ncbi:MAG: tyrosine recombinase XerC [Chlamydiota bacterium]|nr:tyrosine recombinase XerC [Chlamydiota bacterium]
MQRPESDSLIDNYCRYMEGQRNFSQHTISNYTRDIRQFFSYVKTHEPGSMDITKIDLYVLRRYLGLMQRKLLNRASVLRKMASLRSFFKYLVQNGEMPANPMMAISSPRGTRRLPKFLTIDEVNRLLDSVPIGRKETLRDRAVLELLYSTGIRVSELAGLNVDAIDFSAEMIRVMGKGRKERIVPMGSYAAKALQEYLKQRTASESRKAVFVNKFGNRMTVRGVQRVIEKYAIVSGLKGRLTPHTLRHSCATHMLDQGADLRLIQEMLGHVNLSTTQIYTHVTAEKLKRIYDHAHPRA